MWSGLLVVSRLSSYSSSILSSKSRSKDRSNHSRKLGTLADPAATRSDRHACGNPTLTDHDKQATGNREPANEMNKEDPTQGILVWLQPFTVNLEDQEAHVLAHSSERENSDSEGDASRVETSKLKHSVHAYFRKNQKRSILRTEKVWWLDNSRAQSPQRRTWVSEQSPIRCRGTSSRHSVESVSNQNFTGDGEEFTKVLTAVAEAKSYSYVHFY